MEYDISNFRSFCNDKWFEHKDELFVWEHKQPEYDSTYYFQKHRWMLKQMFKEEQKEQKNSLQKTIIERYKKNSNVDSKKETYND